MKNEYHSPIVEADKTAVEVLEKSLSSANISRSKLKQAMQKGCVWFETKDTQGKPYIQRLRRAKKVLSLGDILHCYYDSDVLEVEPANATLVRDQGDYSIWNKPAGMLSQGSKWGDHCTIYRWAEKHLKPERPAFIVHRLDRAASGLIILAHKKKVATQFSEMFQQRSIEKHYQAIVKGNFQEILENKETLKIIDTDIDGKSAISHALFLEYNTEEDESLLDIHIETGRKHQIRKHLAELGYPIVGDRLYGLAENKKDLQLIAVSLAFKCPVTGKEISDKLTIANAGNKTN